MTELEKMLAGETYDFTAPDVAESLRRRRVNLARFNATSFDDPHYEEALSALIPHRAPTARIMPPFYCDHGHPIHLGEGVFINANCTFLDGGGITIGAHTLIGPNCQLYTPQHPMDYRERRKPIEVGRPNTSGEDCWLGGGVIVCPGVRIGARSIITAGSVGVHDIPEDSLAAGNPAVVKRRLRGPAGPPSAT